MLHKKHFTDYLTFGISRLAINFSPIVPTVMVHKLSLLPLDWTLWWNCHCTEESITLSMSRTLFSEFYLLFFKIEAHALHILILLEQLCACHVMCIYIFINYFSFWNFFFFNQQILLRLKLLQDTNNRKQQIQRCCI